MNDADLNRILKSAPVPERSPEAWEASARAIVAAARASAPSPRAGTPERRSLLRIPRLKPALSWALAAACVLAAFVFGFRQGQDSAVTDPRQLARMLKYHQEVTGLFPNQVRAIVFDESGARVVLAPDADVPSTVPVVVSVTGPQGRKQYLTYSGQQIQLGGEACDVLVNPRGEVMIVGQNLVWSSGQTQGRKAGLTIKASRLGVDL